jgi:hypothetical protein
MFPFALTKRCYILSSRKRLGESCGQQGEGSGPHLFLLLPFLYLIQFHAPLLEKSVSYFLWCQYFFLFGVLSGGSQYLGIVRHPCYRVRLASWEEITPFKRSNSPQLMVSDH